MTNSSGPSVKRKRASRLQEVLSELLFLVCARNYLQRLLHVFEERETRVQAPLALLTDGVESSSMEETASREHQHYQQRYEALLEGAPDAVFVADGETGEIVDANQAAASLLETSVDDIIGRHQSELHPQEELEKYQTLFEHHKQQAGSSNATRTRLEDGTQIYVRTDTGARVPVEISASFVDLNGDELFVGIFRDITARKRREEELRAAKREAERASELKSAILANVGHEIRTPITSIIGFAKVLAESLQGTPKKHAENIHQAAQHLMKTISSVLELSKLEAGLKELEREDASLDDAVRWGGDLLGLRAEEEEIELQIDLPENPIEGRWNQEALNRIVQNLLENAIKFTPEGGQVRVYARQNEEEAILGVEDTGIGVDLDEVSELFEDFKQGEEGLTREYRGIGLGLSIVRKLTELLDGEIDVVNRRGKGSRFTVRLPKGR